MINKTSIPRSHSSHGGTLYYVYEVPKDEYYYSRKLSTVEHQSHQVTTSVNKKRYIESSQGQISKINSADFVCDGMNDNCLLFFVVLV